MNTKKYDDLFCEAEQSLEYWKEIAVVEFTEGLFCTMEQKGVSKAELAKRIGSSQAYITKVLCGEGNFTLGTMNKLARALGVVVHVHLAEEHAVVRWIDEIANNKSNISISTYGTNADTDVRNIGTPTTDSESSSGNETIAVG